MITMEMLLGEEQTLGQEDIERWIVNAWIRPDGSAGAYVFTPIDIARVRLIAELRDELQVNEEALPVVLLLLDQLYDVRRRMRVLSEILGRITPVG
jgi:chaperone modulatory protein CbpM